MSQNIKANRSMPVVGLGTFTHTVLNAGIFYCSAQATDVPPSGLSIVINLNGSPVASTPSLNSNAQTIGVDAHMNCASSDVITVVISSSTSNDVSLLNAVKTMIRLDGGAF